MVNSIYIVFFKHSKMHSNTISIRMLTVSMLRLMLACLWFQKQKCGYSWSYRVTSFWRMKTFVPTQANETVLEYTNIRVAQRRLEPATCSWNSKRGAAELTGCAAAPEWRTSVFFLFLLFHWEQNKWNWNVALGCEERCRNFFIGAGTSSSELCSVFTPSFLHRSCSMSAKVLLNASSLFSKLYIVLHPSNLQTHWRLYLRGFPGLLEEA